MNKKKVDELIPKAVEALQQAGIVKDGAIVKTFRGQISTFGAAIVNGSLISAVAFFNEKGSASVERQNLLRAIKILIPGAAGSSNLFEYVKEQGKKNEGTVKEEILNAAIALKLAMNLYELKK